MSPRPKKNNKPRRTRFGATAKKFKSATPSRRYTSLDRLRSRRIALARLILLKKKRFIISNTSRPSYFSASFASTQANSLPVLTRAIRTARMRALLENRSSRSELAYSTGARRHFLISFVKKYRLRLALHSARRPLFLTVLSQRKPHQVLRRGRLHRAFQLLKSARVQRLVFARMRAARQALLLRKLLAQRAPRRGKRRSYRLKHLPRWRRRRHKFLLKIRRQQRPRKSRRFHLRSSKKRAARSSVRAPLLRAKILTYRFGRATKKRIFTRR